jgi:hypothetical protein
MFFKRLRRRMGSLKSVELRRNSVLDGMMKIIRHRIKQAGTRQSKFILLSVLADCSANISGCAVGRKVLSGDEAVDELVQDEILPEA